MPWVPMYPQAKGRWVRAPRGKNVTNTIRKNASDFKAKMHQIQFPLGLRPQTPLRELTALGAPTEPLWLYLRGLLLREGGREGKRRGKKTEREGRRGNGREGMGRERRGREGREGNGSMHPLRFSKVGAYGA